MSWLVLQPTRGLLFTEAQDALDIELASEGGGLTLRTQGLGVVDARNDLFDAAARMPGWERVLLLDDDIVLPLGSLGRLRKALRKAACAVIDYPEHWHPVLSLNEEFTGVAVWNGWTPENNKRDELLWAGLGCVALTREGFGRLRKDGFRFKGSAYGLVRHEDGTFGFDAASRNKTFESGAGEDADFFLNLRLLRIKPAVLPEVAKHLHVERFQTRLAGGQYDDGGHRIVGYDRIDRPGNVNYKFEKDL